MANLEVDFFEEGCIGAEGVVLDAKIQRKGHKLFIDPSSVMPHRRRRPFKPYEADAKLRLPRMVANKRWPEIATWSHTAIGFFPPLVVLALAAMLYGGLSGGGNPTFGSRSQANGTSLVSPSTSRLVWSASTSPSHGLELPLAPRLIVRLARCSWRRSSFSSPSGPTAKASSKPGEKFDEPVDVLARAPN